MGNVFAVAFGSLAGSAIADGKGEEYYTSDEFQLFYCDEECQAKRTEDGPEKTWKEMQETLQSATSNWGIVEVLIQIQLFTWLIPHPLLGLLLEIIAILVFDGEVLDIMKVCSFFIKRENFSNQALFDGTQDALKAALGTYMEGAGSDVLNMIAGVGEDTDLYGWMFGPGQAIAPLFMVFHAVFYLLIWLTPVWFVGTLTWEVLLGITVFGAKFST